MRETDTDTLLFFGAHPEALDTVMWVLFDDRTLAAYERALSAVHG